MILTLEGERIEFLSTGAVQFQHKGPGFDDLTATLEEDTSGGQPSVILQWKSEKPERYNRLPPPAALSAEDLTGYAGTYFSVELGISGVISLTGDRLSYQAGYAQAVPLKQVSVDLFISEGLDIHFEQDQRGKVQKFRLGAGRLCNLEFVRVA